MSSHLRLEGRTTKGRERIKEFGAMWRIVRTSSNVRFSEESGPWAMIVPAEVTQDVELRATLWINLRRDFDFNVQPIENDSHTLQYEI
jgi:hypothetical protein